MTAGRARRSPVAKAVGIVGTGYYLPEHSLNNQDLIDRYGLDTTDEWIISKTGIRERRIAAPDESTSSLAVRAAERALEDAGISGDQLGAVLVATSSPDMIQPPTACIVQGELGARHALACDVSAVCTGFMYAMVLGTGLMAVDQGLDYALIVGAETYSRIIDYSDRTTCVFFGDGAGAAVLGRCSTPSVLSYVLGADGTRSPVMGCPAGGTVFPAHAETVAYGQHYFRMQGREVWDFVIDTLPRVVEEVLERASLGIDDVDLVIPHQANEVLLREALTQARVPLERVYFNIDRYGNTAGASVPIALAEAASLGLLKPGDRALLVAFGGGLTWGGMLVEWPLNGCTRRPERR